MHIGRCASFIFAVCTGLLASEVARAQPPEEYLTIQNRFTETISVSLRARGRGSPNGWQRAIELKPGLEVTFELGQEHGYEPFDITVRKANGTSLVFSDLRLCSWMIECARTGRTDWTLKARGWRRKRGGGDQIDRSLDRKFGATVDENHVTIHLVPLAGIDPREPIEP